MGNLYLFSCNKGVKICCKCTWNRAKKGVFFNLGNDYVLRLWMGSDATGATCSPGLAVAKGSQGGGKWFLPQEQGFKVKTLLHIPITSMWWFPQFSLSFPGSGAIRSCTLSMPGPKQYCVRHQHDPYIAGQRILVFVKDLVLYCLWTRQWARSASRFGARNECFSASKVCLTQWYSGSK